TTQAQGNISLNFSGDVNNIGGKIVAGNNVSINAGRILNDQTAPTSGSESMSVVADPALLWSAVVGSVAVQYIGIQGREEWVVETDTVTKTLGDLLSPTGFQTSFTATPSRCAGGNCTIAASQPVAGSG